MTAGPPDLVNCDGQQYRTYGTGALSATQIRQFGAQYKRYRATSRAAQIGGYLRAAVAPQASAMA